MISPNPKAGMTLVEVLVAMAIFTLSFLVIVDSQNTALRHGALSEHMTLATLLAQQKMAEALTRFQTQPLAEFPEKEEGAFEQTAAKYRWELTTRNFEYDITFLADMARGESEEEASPLTPYLPKISEFIQQSSKELTVTVFWKEGAQERQVAITAHLFNYGRPVAL